NVWKILTRRMGWSPHRPVRQASKRDDQAIQLWLSGPAEKMAQRDCLPREKMPRKPAGIGPINVRTHLPEKYPRILAHAWARKAWLVFIDETGFMLGPVIRRTFAPRGHSPVIKQTDPHRKISVIGALLISPYRRRFRFQFHLLDDDLNSRGPSVA